MSNKSKNGGLVRTDAETGVILARANMADAVAARRDEFTDPKKIETAQGDLQEFENRLKHLNSMTNLFDDDDSEGGPVSGIMVDDSHPQAPFQPSEIDDEDMLGLEEEVIIGGLGQPDESGQDLLGDVFPADDMMAPFDDDEISGAVEHQDDLRPGNGQHSAGAAIANDMDFLPVDEDELARNQAVSKAAQADAEAMLADAETGLAGRDDEVAASDGEEADMSLGANRAEAVIFAGIEGDEADEPQSLASLISRREADQNQRAEEIDLDVLVVGDASSSEGGTDAGLDDMPIPDWARTDDTFGALSGDDEDAGGDTSASADSDLMPWDDALAQDAKIVDYLDETVPPEHEEDDTAEQMMEAARMSADAATTDARISSADLSLEDGDLVVNDFAKTHTDSDFLDEDQMDRDASEDDGGWMDTDEGHDAAESAVLEQGNEGSGDDAEVLDPAAGKKGSRALVFAGGAILAAIIAGGGYFALQGLTGTSVPTTPTIAEPAATFTPVDTASMADVATTGADGNGVRPEGPGLGSDTQNAPDDAATVDDDGDLSDLMMDPGQVVVPDLSDAGEAIADPTDGLVNDLGGTVPQDLADAAAGTIDSLFLEIAPTPEVQASAVTEEMLAGLASQEDVGEIRAAIDLMYQRVETMGAEIVERDDAIVALQGRLADAEARAQRAETLALGQNEVLAEFLRVKEKVDMAENLIVDLSRRTAAMETTDPADRVAVERSINDLNDRLEGMARDLGLIARVAINGSPDRGQGRSAPHTPDVPGAGAVYQQATGGLPAPGEAGQVPSDVAVGDFVQGYGHVLQIMPTEGGARLVVMENMSVLIP